MKNTGKSDGRKITFEIDKKNGKHLQKTHKFSSLSQNNYAFPQHWFLWEVWTCFKVTKHFFVNEKEKKNQKKIIHGA